MSLKVSVCIIGLLLSVALAAAGGFSAEVNFVTRASTGNLFVVEESRLALDRTEDPQVKALAHQLIDEHGAAQAELEAAADGSDASVATTLDSIRQARLTALQSKSGADFDKTYIADQSETHSNALTLYGDYMLLGENKKLKALAIKLIPVTETQLKTVRALPGK
jgi:putative membrane protein